MPKMIDVTHCPDTFNCNPPLLMMIRGFREGPFAQYIYIYNYNCNLSLESIFKFVKKKIILYAI